MLEPAMVKPVQGGLVEKLVLDDRERRNSVGQRILFVQLEFLVHPTFVSALLTAIGFTCDLPDSFSAGRSRL